MFFGEETHLKRASLDRAVDGVRKRFGEGSVRRALLMTDPKLAHLDPNIQSSLQNFVQAASYQ